MGYTNSSLVDLTVKSPNHSGERTHKIDRITPHCVVGQVTAERLGEIFENPSRKASCNYGIAKDGKVVLIVDESNRSWCSSSNSNDQRAITIEVASEKETPYAFNDEAYESLIELCVDICKRNGKKKLLWLETKEKSLSYEPKDDEMIITVHRWFAAKACPGDWLFSRLDSFANEVTKRLNKTSSTTSSSTTPKVSSTTPTTNASTTPKASSTTPKVSSTKPKTSSTTPTSGYKVKVTVDALNIRKGPGTKYGTNGVIRNGGVYTIVQEDNGWGKLASGAGWISLKYTKKI